MSKPFPLLELPTEVRLQIYEAYFSSRIVRVCAVATPSSHTSSAFSLWLACKRIHEESAPLLYPHALFWVDSIQALISLVTHHSSAQLQSIRHFAIRNSLVPLPPLNASRPGNRDRRRYPMLHDVRYRAFYEQICKDLQTLVLFNTTDAGTRRRILEQQAGRSFDDGEFERACFDGMRLKAHVLLPALKGHLMVPVLKGQGILMVGSLEDCFPFRIMLRFLGSDGKHRVGLYQTKKELQQPPVCVEADDAGI